MPLFTLAAFQAKRFIVACLLCFFAKNEILFYYIIKIGTNQMLVADRGLRQYGKVWQIKDSLCYAMLPKLSAQYLGEPSPGRVGLRG